MSTEDTWYGRGGWLPSRPAAAVSDPGANIRASLDYARAQYGPAEPDEDPEAVFAAFDAAEKGVTAPPVNGGTLPHGPTIADPEPGEYICGPCQRNRHRECRDPRCSCCEGDG